MKSDNVKKGIQQAPQPFSVQCSWHDKGRDGASVSWYRKFL